MNKLERMTIRELQEFGVIGSDRREYVKNAKSLYERLRAKDIDDFRTKSIQFVPRLRTLPESKNKLKNLIKETYGIRRLKKTDEENYKNLLKSEIANSNFEEILRIARLNNGMLSYIRDGNLNYYRINENNIQNLREVISGVSRLPEQGSSKEFLVEFNNNLEGIIGVDLNEEHNMFVDEDETVYENQTGGFLLKGHTLPFDFSRYGLFRKDQDTKEYHKYNCLYHALELGGLSKQSLEYLYINFYQRDISKKKLKQIANDLKITIKLRSKNSKLDTYGTEGPIINLCLIEGHYFIHEMTNFTSYYLKNYELVKDRPRNTIGQLNGKFITKNTRFISSKELVEIVLELYSYDINKMDIIDTVYHTKIKSRVVDLEYDSIKNLCTKIYIDEKEQELKNKLNEEIKSNEVLRVFFDFETVLKDNIHVAREVSYRYLDKSYYHCGFDCAKRFIDHIHSIKDYKEIHLIAHNAVFDFNFIVKYLPALEICKSGSKLIFAKSRTKGQLIVVKDSLNFINNPLKDFAKMFNLEECKLEFDFNWIKYEDLDESGKIINKFIRATEKTPTNLIKNGLFNIDEYAKMYNQIDTKVLMDGYNIFAKWAEDLGLNIDKLYTSSSLAKKYAVNQGCFKDTYELAGIPQSFISQAVIGGRVMVQENTPILLRNTKVETLDANSLYPSAMLEFNGFIKGTPKVLSEEQLNMEFLSKQDYYFVDIKINKVGRYLKMPLLYNRTDISIDYTNEPTGIMTVGKVYLEDLIEFQEIEFELLRGYYFNEGFNNKINTTIEYLYNERNRLKNERDKDGNKKPNKAEQIYKLIMNSIYGKCLQKPRDKKITIKDSQKDMIKYFKRNSNRVELAEQLNNCDKWIIREYKEINEDFNSVHIGAYILDYSKRIMNRIICLAEKLDISVYYTDTDSMHLKTDDIPILEAAYFEKYNKKLIGDSLGQVKRDFGKDKNGNDLYATDCVFLGKKTYLDVMSDNHDHFRAKGITQASVEYKSKIENRSILDIYTDRYNGNKQIFDLTCGNTKVAMKQELNFTIRNLTDFTRIF